MIINITPKRGKYAGEIFGFPVSDEDYMHLDELRKPWSLSHASNKDFPYACRMINGQTVSMHRYIMAIPKGDKRFVDHLNGNGQDNRRENLDVVPAAINSARVGPRKKKAKEFRGVFPEGADKYRAKLHSYDLCRYSSKYEAALAVNIAYQAYYGPDQQIYLNPLPEGVTLSEEQERKVLLRVEKIKLLKTAVRSCCFE